MGSLLHCNTGSLRRHMPSVACCVLLWNNYVIVKACSRNITGSTNLAYSEKVNLQVHVRLSFQSLLLFFGKEKSTKCTYFPTEHSCINLPLIFVTQSLVISLKHIKLCISLLSQSLCVNTHITYWHERSSVNSESYFMEMVNKILNS